MLGHFNNALPDVGRPVADLLWLFDGSMAVLAVSTPLLWLVPSWVPMQARIAGRWALRLLGRGDVR
jgi:hypothetical protein